MSAGVSIVATFKLIEKAEEESLGISRGEFVAGYAVMLLIGLAMIYAGWRIGKTPPPK